MAGDTQAQAPAPAASIVVPTRDRPRDLERCLAAIARDPERRLRDVVVVDDRSRDHAAVALVVSRAGARLVASDGAGPAAARNAGVRAARAPIVCFTDDDCEPSPEWANRLAGAMVEGVSAVAGATVNANPGDPFAAASQAITNYVADHDPVPFAPSCNVSCRIEVARALPFDEAFPTAAGEDRDWCARLAAEGHVLAREPAAVVSHHQRLDIGSFARQQVRYGRGAYNFRRRAADGRAKLGSPRFYIGLLAHGAREGLAVGLLVAAAQVFVAAGYAAELTSTMRRRGSLGR